MTMRTLFGGYCIDASAIIDLWSGGYSKDVLGFIWKRVERLIAQGKLLSSIEVYEELKNETKKALAGWLRQNKNIFLEYDDDQIAVVTKIVNDYEEMTNGQKNGADPWVVAVAHSKGLAVITTEAKQTNPSPNTPKIPNLCDEYKVKCLDILGFCRKEKISRRS